MRLIAKFFLWLISVAIPVVIAACYGAPFAYSKTGKVVDSETKEGVNGIQVACLLDGYEQDVAYSWEDGTFWIHYDAPCDSLHLEDVDGEDNGGYYEPRTVPIDEDCEELVVELHE